ncbi:unnamed protein product, partial [Closterium sp. NIES-54]
MDLATAVATRLEDVGYSLAGANARSLEAVDLLLNHTEQRLGRLNEMLRHTTLLKTPRSLRTMARLREMLAHALPPSLALPQDQLALGSYAPPTAAALVQPSSFPPLFSPDLHTRARAHAAASRGDGIEEAGQRLAELRERKQQIHDDTILLAAQCVVDPLRDQSQQHTAAADANLTAAVQRYLSLANEVTYKVDRDLIPWMQRNPPPRPIKIGPRASAVHSQHSALLK